MSKPTVFISYSHRDEDWKDKLLPHLKMLEQQGRLVVWDDRRIDAGESWYPEIREAMERAAVAVCLISANFLASDFCVKEEVPFLLGRREREGMVLIPVLVDTCAFELIDWLAPLQMLPRDGKSIASDYAATHSVVFTDVARRVNKALESPEVIHFAGHGKPGGFAVSFVTEAGVDIERLPQTGFELFGRQKELRLLDEAWESVQTNVISLVAYGGVGKTTLVNKWLERIAADNYRGAKRVYAWSFYSQGTNEQATSADFFFNEALQWFGEEDPTRLSIWEKGERLGELIQGQKTLLILDGLEPLQSGFDFDRGEIKDPALEMLISRLARQNDGLCVITTREKIAGRHADSLLQLDLEQISPQAARALLRVGGVRGSDSELEEVSRLFGPQALAVQLLAVYLHDIPGHPANAASDIPDLDLPVEQGKHARRVIAALEKRLTNPAARELLRLLGLFDRPASKEELAALREAPAIVGLTDHMHGQEESDWQATIDTLRSFRLLAPKSQHRPEALDAHPIVREHFTDLLQQHHPDACREGHRRLYQHLKESAKQFPDTLEEMMPLYRAIGHGCLSGEHLDALRNVYIPRICRGNQFHNINILSAHSTDLAALSYFFDERWGKLNESLSQAGEWVVLNYVGFRLRSLGRLRDAKDLFRDAAQGEEKNRDWEKVAVNAINQSQVALLLGCVSDSVNYGLRGLDYSEESGDTDCRIIARTSLGQVLHWAGNSEVSETLFSEAEKIQGSFADRPHSLEGTKGYKYCELLVELGQLQEASAHAQNICDVAETGEFPLSLGLGRVALALAEFSRKPTVVDTHLKTGLDNLRQSGYVDFLVAGLLTGSRLNRLRSELDFALAYAEEAYQLSIRSEMLVFQIEATIELCWLDVATGNNTSAVERLHSAKRLIQRTEGLYTRYSPRDPRRSITGLEVFQNNEVVRYRRRDREVNSLEERLK